jgi:flagellar assembly protein FliH
VEERAGIMSAGEIEELRRSAYREGVELGRRDAFRATSARLQQILDALAEPLGRADEQVLEELAALVIACGRQVIRRELRIDPREIVGVIREAVGVLPATSREVRVHLHPDDALLVRELLSGAERSGRWNIEDDPSVSRGGCRVLTEWSAVDMTLEKRLSDVAARMLGEERADRRA